MMSLFVVGLGGFIGAVSRFYLSNIINNLKEISFPLGTFIVNIIGCLFIGIVMYLVEEKSFLSPNLKLLLLTGLLGSFTTFSTFGFDTLHLFRLGDFFSAGLNILLNVLVGLLAVYIGRYCLKYII